jgi:hypothetical protein
VAHAANMAMQYKDNAKTGSARWNIERAGSKGAGVWLCVDWKKQVSVPVSKSCTLEGGPLCLTRARTFISHVRAPPQIHTSLAISPTVEACSLPGFDAVPIRGYPC